VIGTTIWQPPSRPATMPWADYEAWNAWATPEVINKYDLSHSVARANQLLDGLGSTLEGNVRTFNGKPLQLNCITPVPTTGLEYQIASNHATSAKEAGIDIAVRSLPGSAFGDAFSTGQYDLTSHWLCGMQFDPNQLYRGFHSRNYFPVGERANRGGDAGNTRFKNAELDAAIEKLEAADPTDAAARPVFDQALDLFMSQAPAVPIIQTIYPMMFSTAYWTGWPTADNPYTIPATWWSHFLFAIGNLQPTAAR
jgi:peptide/nickel transport system substrate-binding protein